MNATDFKQEWLNACFSKKKARTGMVVVNDKNYAEYSLPLAIECAKDMLKEYRDIKRIYVYDTLTGELVYDSEGL